MINLKKIGFQNFRLFKKQDFELAPITILTGPNSSGKSTIVRGLRLLAESAERDNLKLLLKSKTETGYSTFSQLRNNDNESVVFTLGFKDFSLGESSNKNIEFTLFYDHNIDSPFGYYNEKKSATSGFTLAEISSEIRDKFIYLPAYRIKPSREFNRSDDNHLSKLLFKIYDKEIKTAPHPFEAIQDAMKDNPEYQDLFPVYFTNEFIRIFELGDSVVFKPNNYNGNYELLIKDHKSGECTNIADLGSGISSLIVLMLHIDFGASYAAGEFQIVEHADGLNIEAEFPKKSDRTILIEEPEISLHPNFQSMLADLLVRAHNMYGVRFIVETHSEYLIQKLQYLIAKSECDSNDVIIHYLFEKRKKLGPNTIKISKDGRLSSDFGSGFFDESLKTIFSLWEIQGLN